MFLNWNYSQSFDRYRLLALTTHKTLWTKVWKKLKTDILANLGYTSKKIRFLSLKTIISLVQSCQTSTYYSVVLLTRLQKIYILLEDNLIKLLAIFFFTCLGSKLNILVFHFCCWFSAAWEFLFDNLVAHRLNCSQTKLEQIFKWKKKPAKALDLSNITQKFLHRIVWRQIRA